MLKRDSEALARQLQQAIEQINGVTSARVLLDGTGDIAEIHLVGSSARKPKQIVRDTESLIYAHFGIRVDYRKISLVQLDAANISLVPSRLVFISASAFPQAGDCARVILQSEGRAYEGIASIHPDAEKDGCSAAVAGATISAVQQAIGTTASLVVQEVQSVPADGRQLSLVVIRALTPQGSEVLAGTCLVRGNALDAVAKATLDAINRRLPVWFRADGNTHPFPPKAGPLEENLTS